VIYLGGAITAGCYAVLSIISAGENPPQVALFFCVLGTAWAVLLLLCFGRGKNARMPAVHSIIVWAIVFRFIGLTAIPVYEDDYNRFLWDGWVFVSSGNPYQKPPIDFYGDANVPIDLRRTLYDVAYPGVPTIYGPVLQFVFGASALISPANLITLKCLFLIADLALMGLIAWRSSRRTLLLYAWCPLLIFEVSFNAHPDLLGAALVFAGYQSHLRGRIILPAVLVGLACAVKILAVVAVPVLIWRGRWRSALAFAITLLAVYTPFILQGSTADWEGLLVFAEHWEFNSALYAIVHKVAAAPIAKLLCYGLFACVYAALFIIWTRGRIAEFPLDGIYGLFLFVSPVINPWYLLWIMPFAVRRPRIWSITALIAVSLSYATISNLSADGAGNFGHPSWLRPVEFGIILLAIAIDAIVSAKSRREQPEKKEAISFNPRQGGA